MRVPKKPVAAASSFASGRGMRGFWVSVCMILSASCGGAPFTTTFGDGGGAGATATGSDTATSPIAPVVPSARAGAATGTDASAETAFASGNGEASAADQAVVDRASPALMDSGAPVADATAARDGSSPDAAPSPVAGMLACGTSVCNEATQFCCVQASGFESCQSSSDTCAMLGGARRDCDKASDCPNGEVCCYDFSSIPATTGCHADCGGGGSTRVQACRTQAECLSGACSVHACTTGGSIESCAPFAPECP